MAREPGIYWVKNRLGEWSVAFYVRGRESDHWQILSEDVCIADADAHRHFQQIGPRFDTPARSDRYSRSATPAMKPVPHDAPAPLPAREPRPRVA